MHLHTLQAIISVKIAIWIDRLIDEFNFINHLVMQGLMMIKF